jgi:hypothetical protein
MVQSFERFGYEVAATNAEFPYGRVFNNLVQMYRRAATGHETFVYSDGGDTFCQRPFTVPNDRLIWTKTTPAILHGNGRTPMDWVYNLNN